MRYVVDLIARGLHQPSKQVDPTRGNSKNVLIIFYVMETKYLRKTDLFCFVVLEVSL